MIYQFADLELDTSRRQVSRNGDPVKLTKLSFKLLQALLETAPALLTHDELIDKVWGPRRVVSLENLSQRIMVLRQSLGDQADAPVYVEGVRGEGYRLMPPVAAGHAGPGALPGLEEAPALIPSAQARKRRGWTPIAALAAALLVAALALFWSTEGDRYQRRVDRPGTGGFASIAVLPFVNLSPDVAHSYFADGIHEEVLNKLSKLTGLRVISRTSMLRYENTREPIPKIARELQVDSVVEGSVRYAENRIRVTIQVVDGERDVHLWSETYDRELKDIFQIESEIARDVAAALHQVIADEATTGGPKPPTQNLDAYAEYMQGRQAMTQRKISDLKLALQHFETATILDPDYALAWVGLADSWRLLSGYSSLDTKETFSLRQSAIDRALDLDPSSGEAWLSLASLRADQDLPEEAEQYYLRSIELYPGNAQAHHWYGHFLTTEVNRPEEALPHLRKAVALDPLSPLSSVTNGALAMALWSLGRVEETLAIERRRIDANPDNAVNMQLFSGHLVQLGRLDEALYWAREGARADPANFFARKQECFATLTLGDDPALERCHSAMLADFPQASAGKSLKYWPGLYIYRQQPELLLDRMREAYELDPGEESLWWLGFAHLYNGQIAESRSVFSEMWPDLFGTNDITVKASNLEPVVVAGVVLMLGGETDRANYLFDEALLRMESMHRIRSPAFGFADITIHVFRDERSKAIAALRDAIDSGWRQSWWQLRGPGFETMNEEPAWRALHAELLDDINRQRENYYAHIDEPEYWR